MHAIRPAMTAVGRWLRSVRPERAHLRADLVAGLPGAISSVPDGMAAAVLAGVNPVQGLYASFAGPIVGGLSSNTRMMVITTTSAAALAAGSALQSVPPDQRPAAIPLLVILVGIALVGRGYRPPRPLHQVRLVLGDDRVPHWYLGQYRLRPDRRSHRDYGARQLPAGQGRRRAHPSERHRSGVPAHRAERARDPGGAGADPPVRDECADRPGDTHPRGDIRRRRPGGQGRRPG